MTAACVFLPNKGREPGALFAHGLEGSSIAYETTVASEARRGGIGTALWLEQEGPL
jgi:hypothetical protein